MFDSIVSLELFIYGPGIGSASNRSKYQEYFLGGGRVKAAGEKTDSLTTMVCRLPEHL